MTLSLITTVGAADANSYGTLAEFAAYLETRINASAVLALTDEQKTALLIQAARDLDALPFEGIKYNTDILSDGTPCQALQFPRNYTYWTDGAFIPQEVKHAQFEQAVFLNTLQSEGQEPGDVDRLESFKRGSVSMTFRAKATTKNKEEKYLAERARFYLRDHLLKDRSIRLVR